MNDRPETSGPQFRADPPQEQPAVRMTIVGGRPPGSGQGIGTIPRGVEVLVRKAAVDPEFRAALLAERAAAAMRIGLTLEPSEEVMLEAVPQPQLAAVIDRTRVPQEHRRAFLGNVAAAMLAALGIASSGCSDGGFPAPTGMAPDKPPTKGIQPDMPPEKPKDKPVDRTTKGDDPDGPPAKPAPKPPDAPPAPTGSRPDMP